MASIYTIGYEGMTLDTFVERLRSSTVDIVVDVRANPVSRKPGFAKRALAEAMADANMAYIHVVELGCPRVVRDRYDRDGDWGAYTVGFRAHLRAQSAQVASLADLSARARVCLLCFEKDPNRCHRSLVARAVAGLSGAAVIHLTAKGVEFDTACRVAA